MFGLYRKAGRPLQGHIYFDVLCIPKALFMLSLVSGFHTLNKEWKIKKEQGAKRDEKAAVEIGKKEQVLTK